ncbi:MAG: acyl--CoA ligase [Ruminococcaceae bacterium]|nr:acyl--CoA ligase [Oscillospiraceae bacterium]
MIKYSLECLDKMAKELSYVNIFDIYCSHGNRPCIQYTLDGEIKIITYAQFENVVKHVADNLIDKLGDINKGFVAIKVDNAPEWPALFWGVLMAGYKPFLIDYRHALELTQFFIDQAKAVAIITTEQLDIQNTLIIDANDLILMDKRQILDLAALPIPTDSTPGDRIRKYSWGDEIALCTSGTTSTAKIFTYNGEAMSNQVLSARQVIIENEIICSDSPKRNLAFLPLHHIFGFMANYFWYSFFATSMVFPANKAPSSLLAACKEHKVTHILAVPLLVNNIVNGLQRKLSKEKKFKRFMFNAMLKTSLLCQRINPVWGTKVAKKLFKKSVLSNLAGDSIEIIISGGGHLLPETLKVISGIGYYTICGFGMTETGISSMERNKSLKKRLASRVGAPVSCIEYRIVPMDPSNPDVGELQIRGKSLHSGVVKNGQILSTALNSEGWFETGDIGRLEDGALYIEGRLKEVIVNESGENVYPDELEDYFTELEGVTQFTVLGISKGGGNKYEDITLVMQSSKDVSDKEYLARLLGQVKERNNRLPVFKKLSRILVTNDSLPLANGIKIKRAEIKKQIEAGQGNYVDL